MISVPFSLSISSLGDYNLHTCNSFVLEGQTSTLLGKLKPTVSRISFLHCTSETLLKLSTNASGSPATTPIYLLIKKKKKQPQTIKSPTCFRNTRNGFVSIYTTKLKLTSRLSDNAFFYYINLLLIHRCNNFCP